MNLKEDLNWGNAESFVSNYKVLGEETQIVKLSYFLQNNSLVKSKEISSTSGYCELSTTVAGEDDGAKINLISNDKFFISGYSKREQSSVNNLKYAYAASFALTLQNTKKIYNLRRPQFELQCFNIMDATDLKAAVGFKFEIN